jgi:hypothetical protein
MNPWLNIIFLIPAIIIAGSIILIRIKGRLENQIFRYRQEGIILQTSLAFFKLRESDDRWRLSIGLVLLTGKRLIVLDWRRETVFECVFHVCEEHRCHLRPTDDRGKVTVTCNCKARKRELMLNVRNPDAWALEFSRLRSYSSFE